MGRGRVDKHKLLLLYLVRRSIVLIKISCVDAEEIVLSFADMFRKPCVRIVCVP